MVLPVCVGPITYTGQDIIAADIAHLRAALDAAGIEEGFMTAIAPAVAAAFRTNTTRPKKN